MKFLYTPQAQNILAQHFYRVSDRAVSGNYRQRFQLTRHPHRRADAGAAGTKVAKEHLGPGRLAEGVGFERHIIDLKFIDKMATDILTHPQPHLQGA